MPARVIDGRAIASGLLEKVAEASAGFVAKAGRKPGLAAVLVGEDPASQTYIRLKKQAAEMAGFHFVSHVLPKDSSDIDVCNALDALNANPAIDGIILQLPLPSHLIANQLLGWIDPAKDVDGLHPVNVGLLVAGLPTFLPCTPQGCMRLLREMRPTLAGLQAVVIGRSAIVGRPMAQLLLQADCTVTMAHSKTKNLDEVVRGADIVIAAAGKPELVRGHWLKPGASVIDVGINRLGGKLVGDVAFAEALPIAGAITPVPGGVGPMTIACLLANTVKAAFRQAELAEPGSLAA